MAVDKLVDSAQLESDLTSVANAIRAKTCGTVDLQFPDGFVSEIGSISGGGGISVDDFADLSEPSGNVTINGTQIGIHALRNRTAMTGISGPNVTSIGEYALYYDSGLVSVDFPSLRTVGKGAFGYCSGLVTVSLPNLTDGGETMFNYCTNLVSVNLPKLEYIGNSGNYTFLGCSKLEGIVLPSFTGTLGNGIFRTCNALEYIDVYSPSKLNSPDNFGASTRLDTIIVRGNRVMALSAIACMANTCFGDGKSGGTLYVPSSMISSYQSASNWSTILAYANNSIEAIEGSQYENYYADGTPIT